MPEIKLHWMQIRYCGRNANEPEDFINRNCPKGNTEMKRECTTWASQDRHKWPCKYV
jgi:hypothetical protein